MRAAVLHGPRDIRIETRALLTPGEGEAVVQVFASGLCGTDYRIWNGNSARRTTFGCASNITEEPSAPHVGAGRCES